MEQLDGLDGYAPTRHSCDCPSRLQLRPLVMLRFDIDPYPLASVNYDSIHRRLAMRTCTLRHRPPAMRTCTLRHQRTCDCQLCLEDLRTLVV